MDAVEVDARFEDIGVARQRKRSQISAVGAAPYSDSIPIDQRVALQKARPGEDVLIFRSPGWPPTCGEIKVVTVSDPAPVVDGEHDESTARQVLVDRVRVRIVVHVMPRQQHLTKRAAVHEHDRRMFSTAARQKELTVNHPAVGGAERNFPRRYELRRRKVAGK